MAARRTVGIVGTFDVENYGDLLFPMMARTAFERRNLPVDVVAYSPNRRDAPAWPYPVRPLTVLPQEVRSLSALLIGGGQILRFDQGYPIPTDPAIDVPIDYWLTPAVLGTLAGIPLVWNAIGAWTGSPRAPWHDDTLRSVFSASAFIGLRDEASRRHLADIAPAADLQLLPDTVFSIARYWPLGAETASYEAWRRSLGLSGRYVVVQADPRFHAHRAAIDQALSEVQAETVVYLPVCRCHGDDSAGLAPPAGRGVHASGWPDPRLLSEIIGRSDFLIASSLHACITALAYGVPAARVPSFNAADRKFELLEGFAGVAAIDDPGSLARLARRGRQVEDQVEACADRLDQYWDRVAGSLLSPGSPPADGTGIMLGWALRTLKELAAIHQRHATGHVPAAATTGGPVTQDAQNPRFSSEEMEDRLERGELILYPKAPFRIPDGDDLRFLLTRTAQGAKSISYFHELGRMTGHRPGLAGEDARLQGLLRGFTRSVADWLAQALPRYHSAMRFGPLRFRTEEEEGRTDVDPRYSGSVLHVDMSSDAPAHGESFLRVFVNINPDQPRRWITSDNLGQLLDRWGDRVRLPGEGKPEGPARRSFDPDDEPPADSPYHQLMSRLHFHGKTDEYLQRQAPVHHWEFPPGSAWLVFSDIVSHAVQGGRYAIDQTFLIPAHGFRDENRSTKSVIERFWERKRAAGPTG